MTAMVLISPLAGGIAAFVVGRGTGVLSGKLALGLSALPLLGVGLGLVFC
jgi:hypothetical protein